MTATMKSRDEVRYELVAEPVSDMRVTDPIQIIRRSLRGRYALAALLALLFGALGGFVGYFATEPTYEATGLIRVAPSMPSVLSDEQKHLSSTEYADYVARQITHLTSRPVLESASNAPTLAAHNWPTGMDGVTLLESSMQISRNKGEPFIGVVITHQHPVIARDAANAILEAYSTVAQKNVVSDVDETEIVALLKERETNLENQLFTVRQNMLDVTDQYGAEANEQLHASKVDELVAIDQKLAEIAIAISAHERGDVGTSAITTVDVNATTTDRVLSQLRNEEETILAEIDSWSKNYGPAHPIIRELNRRLDAVRIRIDLREGTAIAAAPSKQAGHAPKGLVGASLDQLLELETGYRTMRENVRKEAAILGQRRLAVQSLLERATELRERLAGTRDRIDSLTTEKSVDTSDRATIASFAETPFTPVRDRRKGLASAGAVLGGLLGVGFMVFWGLVDRRCRFIADLLENLPELPVLAVVPELSDRDNETNNESVIAVHQLRNLLRTQTHHTRQNIFAITSTNGGEGKTSLTLALGASFAGAGNTTLIIDADPVNCALTRELNLSNLPGLCQAIGPDSSSGEVHRTRTDNLWVLPVGASGGFDPQRLSYEKLNWLLDAVRDRFDIILIDTGSVMTAPEAPLVAACADQAIMLVNRNQSMPHVDAATRRLEQNGTSIAGIVFNRVAAADLTTAQRSISRTAPSMGAVEMIPNAIPQTGYSMAQYQNGDLTTHTPFGTHVSTSTGSNTAQTDAA